MENVGGFTEYKIKTSAKNEELNTEPEQLPLVIDQPKACELYYVCCVMVNRHSRCRQADLQIERNWKQKIGQKESILLCCLFILSMYGSRILVF